VAHRPRDFCPQYRFIVWTARVTSDTSVTSIQDVDEANLREQATKYGLEDKTGALIRYPETHGEVDDDRLPK